MGSGAQPSGWWVNSQRRNTLGWPRKMGMLSRVIRWFRPPVPLRTNTAAGDAGLVQGEMVAAGWYAVLLHVAGEALPGAPWLRAHHQDGGADVVSLPAMGPGLHCRILYLGRPLARLSLGLPIRDDQGGPVKARIWRAGPAWLVLWLAWRRFGWRGAVPGLWRAAMVLPTRPHTALGRWLVSDGMPVDMPQRRYDEWVQLYDTPGPQDLERMRRRAAAMGNRPLISVVMPVYEPRPDLLEAAIDSVLAQVYDRWELCIADDCSPSPEIGEVLRRYTALDSRIRVVFRDRNGHISAASNSALALASGEFVALLDHDDLLPPHALLAVAEAVEANPQADLLYSDEDRADEQGQRYEPYFKSDWNPTLFLGQNMISHLGVYRRSLMQELGGFREGFEGSQDYDLALRVVERTTPERIVHIPRVLYHWRATAGSTAVSPDAKSYAWDAGKRAIEEHLGRVGTPAEVIKCCLSFYRPRWPQPGHLPLVSFIIPTRDRLDLLRGCIDGLLHHTDYPAWEAIVVDNGSVEPETLRYLAELAEDGRFRVLRIDAPFNYSTINNEAAGLARGELLCLLNNDVVMIESDWLAEMVRQMRDGVAIVGAKLLYADGRLQHGGVILGLGGLAAHFHRLIPGHNWGYFGRAALVQDLSCVTAACLLIRHDVFRQVGGFDPELAVTFNDVDLCIRVREAGWRLVWTPHALLYHLESATRGEDLTPEQRERFEREKDWVLERWGELLPFDPYYNPNLSLGTEVPEPAFPPRIAPVWASGQDGE